MNFECYVKKFVFDFEINKELLKDLSQVGNGNGFELLKDYLFQLGCGE